MKNTYQKITSYEAKEPKKVLLLYSGGLDTSVMIKWIMDTYGAEVYTLTINIGQPSDNFDEVKAKALKLGAKKAFVVDAQKEFANEYLTKAIKANANYQDGYHLFCPLGRAAISKKAVEFAQKEGLDVIAHGCTGKGNDQVRFDSYITTLDPSLKIIAPVREWGLTRTEEIEYAKKHGIEVSNHNPKYSYDENLWGNSAEGTEIEDVKLIPPLDQILIQNKVPQDAPNKPAQIEILFKEGLPVALNGTKLDLLMMIKTLAKLGAEYGIGLKHYVEDRIVGLKVRGVYEQPAAKILTFAHKSLESLVSTHEENEFKMLVDNKWASLCYRAQWYDPLINNLNSFIDQQNKKVSGKVTLVLYKGWIDVVAMDSPYSLIDSDLCSFNSHKFNQQASASFIEHYGFQMKAVNNIEKPA